MTKNKLPQVILFQEDEKALNYKYRLPFTLNANIAVKSIEYDLEELRSKGIKLEGPRPEKDTVYYLHPYKEHTYIHEDLGEMYLLREKLDLYRRVGSLLGAKSISTEVEIINSEKVEIDINTGLELPFKKIEAEVNFEYERENKEYRKLEINEKFNLKENYDLNKNIDELRGLIERLYLQHESEITSLIEARDSRESGVELSERVVNSEISSEYNKLVKVSAQFSSPIFSVSSDFKRSLERLNRLNMKIEYVF